MVSAPDEIDPTRGSGIPSSKLNSFFIYIATRGYLVQSRLFRIPDGLGFFSTGPPRLQVNQAQKFVFFVSHVAMMCPLLSILTWAFYVHGTSILGLFLFAFAWFALVWAAFYYTVCNDPRRDPNYDWEKERLFRD